MKPPDGLMGEGLQKNCQGVKVLHFDERSRIGATTLGWADYLCRCGFNKDESWGGLPVVVLFGDDIQLPPVLDSPVYISKGTNIAKINAVCKGSHVGTVPCARGSGLQKVLFLCKGAKVSLSANLSVKYGLFNRAVGKVIDIISVNGRKPSVDQPEFPTYSGPPFLEENTKVVPIIPIERRVECYCRCCKRKQIPLRLGWATTIHSCQGFTVGENQPNRYIVINPGTKQFELRNPGAMFVSLSRAKPAGSFYHDPDFAWNPSVLVNEDRLCFAPKT
ncbi:uncharacterized protein LOC144433002 [Glandiceps talaboti]